MFNRLLLILFVSVQYGVIAQSNSPYAYAGTGERVNSNHPVFSGLGNHSSTYSHPSVLNTSNPASYSFIRFQFPIFSVGTGSRFSFNNQDGAKEFNSSFTISEVAMGMSFSKLFGFAFGIKPFQRKSYSFTEKSILMSDSIRYQYEGKGSLNKAFLGFSVKILNFDSLKWSIGGNVGAVFGNTTDLRKSALISTVTNAGGISSRTQDVRSFHYDLGTMFMWQLKKGHKITVGGTFEPLQNIRSTYNSQLLFSPTDVNNSNTYSILSEIGDTKGKLVFAPNYNIGLSYAKTFVTLRKNGNERTSQLAVFASYSATNWSKYREDFRDSSFTYNFKNSSGVQVGVEFIPEVQYVVGSPPKFFERASYRVGFYSNTLPYTYNNAQLTEWAATVGFGFPMIVDKRLDSSIQFSLGAGKRGTNQVGALNETFLTFNIGVLIAPSVNDRWFVKRKLD